MDSEKHHHVQELIKNGRSPNDEGPFYHHAWWESYKGSIKGKLGGTVVGAIAGAVVGGAIFAAMTVTGLLPAGLTALGVIGGMSAAGMLYANAEFSRVGTVTGAVAAVQQEAEDRMQAFEQSRFNELKKEIGELKSMVGKHDAKSHPEPKNSIATNESYSEPKEVDKKLDDYRVTHHDPAYTKPKGNGLVFWKVTLTGLAVGAGVGLLLEAVGATSAIAGALGELGVLVKGAGAAAITGGVIGASFGINRDFFRKIFDKTDLAFKGMFKFIEPSKQAQPETPSLNASKERPQVTTMVYPDSGIEYPTSDTFHRDQLAARANQLLASLDHTTVSRH